MKPEFEKLLGNDKDKFIKNVKNSTDWDESTSLDERLHQLENYKSFFNFIANAFTWQDTPEGVDFWDNMASRK